MLCPHADPGAIEWCSDVSRAEEQLRGQAPVMGVRGTPWRQESSYVPLWLRLDQNPLGLPMLTQVATEDTLALRHTSRLLPEKRVATMLCTLAGLTGPTPRSTAFPEQETPPR